MSEAGREFRIRRAETWDVSVIAHHRAAMFRDMGSIPPGDYDMFRISCEAWLAKLMASGGYAGWLCEGDGTVVAGGGIMLLEMGPAPYARHIHRWAHIVNVYTEPLHRRRGLARGLMQTLIDWCSANGYERVTLTASDEGRPLYESMGFRASGDMRLV